MTLEDTDYYTCVAENGYGYDYSSFIVEVVDTGVLLYYLMHISVIASEYCEAMPSIVGNTVEPPNKGHFGAKSFVPCREVVPTSEGPLSEVPLYMVDPPNVQSRY